MNASAADAFKALIRRSLPLVIALMALGALAVNGVRQIQGPAYAASARVLISSSSLTDTITGTEAPYQDPKRVQATAEALAGSAGVYRIAARSGAGSASELRGSTKVASIGEDDLLTFTSSSEKSPEAVKMANAVARAYTQYRSQLATNLAGSAIARLRTALAQLPETADERPRLQEQLSRLLTLQRLGTNDAVVVDPADSAGRTRPNPGKDTLLGLSLGLVIALVLVALRTAIDTRIRSERDVEDLLGLPVMASIRSLPRGSRLVTYGRHTDMFGDVYGLLAARVTAQLSEGEGSVLAITSAVANEGKTTTAANLAVTLARRGARVILVDADPRKATATSAFTLPPDVPGVLEVLEGRAEIDDVLWSIDPYGASPEAHEPGGLIAPELLAVGARSGSSEAGARRRTSASRRSRGSAADLQDSPARGDGTLHFLPAGRSSAAAAGVPIAFDRLISNLRRMADIVLIDTPAALLTAQMTELAPTVDGVMLVVRDGQSTQRSLQSLRRQAHGWSTELIGVIITDVPDEDVYGPYTR